MPTPTGAHLFDPDSLSPGSFPTRIRTIPPAPVQRVTERISGFWVDGVDLSSTDERTRGGECDTATFLAARAAALTSPPTVRIPRGPICVSWTKHCLFHPLPNRPPSPEPINLPQYVLDTIFGQISSNLQKIFPGRDVNISDFMTFVITQLRLRRREVERKYKGMKDCRMCYNGSNTSTPALYESLLSRELMEDLLANDDKLIKVLRETIVILEDASHSDNPLVPYSVSDLRRGGVETFVLAAFLMALGESEGHTENHMRFAIEILSSAMPEYHRYRKYVNLEFLDRAMAELHGYRRSYLKFPQ